jgi:hypothetical protein
MMRKNSGERGVTAEALLHFANRNATRLRKGGDSLHSANVGDPSRHLEQACVSLQRAATELEVVMTRLPGSDEQADLHEAIGSIMETLRLISGTHARLAVPAAAE